MSWDVMIFNTRGKTPPSIEEFQESDCESFGAAAAVRQGISMILPGIDWSDPTWGIYDGDGFSIEFNVGSEDPIESIMLHVRGGGDAISAITSFARPLGWTALDCTTGELLDLDNPSQVGWENFQAFRDKVIDHNVDDDDFESSQEPDDVDR